MAGPLTVTAYDPYVGIRTLGSMWVLRRGDLEASCVVTTHPLGWELQLKYGDLLMRSHVCKDAISLMEMADAWRKQVEAKGWLDGPQRSGEGDPAKVGAKMPHASTA